MLLEVKDKLKQFSYLKKFDCIYQSCLSILHNLPLGAWYEVVTWDAEDTTVAESGGLVNDPIVVELVWIVVVETLVRAEIKINHRL